MEIAAAIVGVCRLGWTQALLGKSNELAFLSRERARTLHHDIWNHPTLPHLGPESAVPVGEAE